MQCENCGAVLLDKDLFCGECGAPRTSLPEPVEPEPSALPAELEPAADPSPAVSSAAPSAREASTTATGWRVAFVVLLVLGVLACLAGLLAFVVFGATPGENTTVEEDWLYSAMCCLLPVGGTGLVLLAAGVTVWFSRLREN
jgi:hypothetical protein